MRENLQRTHGVIYSGQVLLALMRRGLSRRRAYEMVQRCAMSAWRNPSPAARDSAPSSRTERRGQDFADLLRRDPAIGRHLTAQEMKRCVDPQVHLKHVDRIFKRVGL
jgi:adenylosuccinate lyase